MLGKGHGSLYKASTKGESKRLRGGGDKVKFADFRFKRWQVANFGKGGRQYVPQFHVLGMNDYLLDDKTFDQKTGNANCSLF